MLGSCLNHPRNSTLYKVTGTETFRLASAKILDTWGSNLQNVEKSLRRIYCADDGKKFGQRDQSGAEALIVAHLAPKGQYRDLFYFKVKPHVFVALHVFADQWRARFKNRQLVEAALHARVCEIAKLPGWKDLDDYIKSSDDWPSKERFYFLGKKIVHASSYGLGPNTFVDSILAESGATIILSRAEATAYLEMFHKLFPEIRRWHIRVQQQLKAEAQLRNLFGFPFKFTGYIGESMFKEAYAFVPQSTVGTITNIAYTNLQAFIEDNNKEWNLLANTHDSYLMEFPEDEETEAMAKMREYLEQELVAPDGTKFRMRSEGQTGYNWAPRKEKRDGTVWNERGLRAYND